jgi:ATP-binding cassette subfamily F protein uup
LPERIGALEDEQREIASRLEDPALYRADPRAANALSARLAEIDGELTALLERWEELEK